VPSDLKAGNKTLIFDDGTGLTLTLSGGRWRPPGGALAACSTSQGAPMDRGNTGTGKRGPNGGVIDIDDPHEVFPESPRIVLVKEIRNALGLAEFAAAERIAGREGNAEALRTKAALKLADAILAVVGK
jgi:hypothetical protein